MTRIVHQMINFSWNGLGSIHSERQHQHLWYACISFTVITSVSISVNICTRLKRIEADAYSGNGYNTHLLTLTLMLTLTLGTTVNGYISTALYA